MTNPPRVEPRINVNCIITPILHPLQSRPDDFCSATYPQQPHGIIEKELSMKQFTTIEKLDTGILYLLELASNAKPHPGCSLHACIHSRRSPDLDTLSCDCPVDCGPCPAPCPRTKTFCSGGWKHTPTSCSHP